MKLQKTVPGAYLTIFQGNGASQAKNQFNLFYHKLGNGYFIINKFFEKIVFLEKSAKTPFVGGRDPFEHKCSFKKKI